MTQYAKVIRWLAKVPFWLTTLNRAYPYRQARVLSHLVLKVYAGNFPAHQQSPNHDLHFNRGHECVDLEKRRPFVRIYLQQAKGIGFFSEATLVFANKPLQIAAKSLKVFGAIL